LDTDPRDPTQNVDPATRDPVPSLANTAVGWICVWRLVHRHVDALDGDDFVRP